MKDLIAIRLEFVTLASQPSANVRLLCRRFGISPTAGYKWLERFQSRGTPALADRSRRPRRSPARTALALEEQVVALRRQHPAWGARKLRQRLARLGHWALPATSTITGILHRHGLISSAASQAAARFQRLRAAGSQPIVAGRFQRIFAAADRLLSSVVRRG